MTSIIHKSSMYHMHDLGLEPICAAEHTKSSKFV